MSTSSPWKLEAAAEKVGLAGPIDFVVEGGRCRAQHFAPLSTQQNADLEILQPKMSDVLPGPKKPHGSRHPLHDNVASQLSAMHFAPRGGAVRYGN